MNEDSPNLNLGLDEYLKPKRQKTEEKRFAQLLLKWWLTGTRDVQWYNFEVVKRTYHL